MHLLKLLSSARSVALMIMMAVAAISSFAVVGAMHAPTQASPAEADTAQQYVASSPEQIPPEQQAALADGVVTYEEHEAAVQRTIACAESAGVRMEVVPGAGVSVTQLGFVAGTWEETQRSQKALDSCIEQLLKYIEIASASQPVDSAVIADSSDRLVKCMTAAGATGLSPTTVRSEIDALVSKRDRSSAEQAMLRIWDTCRSQVVAETGFLP